MSNPNQINSSNNPNLDNLSNPNIHSTITTPQSASSSASTPYSFSSNPHQPPTLSRSNITPYNFQNIYNQQFQFSHQQQHPVQHQNDQFLTYAHDPAPGNPTQKNQHQNPNPSDPISLQTDMQPLNSPISTQQHQHQHQQQQQLPHPQSQGIIMSPAISSNLQYVQQTYFPPPTGPPQQIQLTIPNQNPTTSLNPGITQPMIGNLIPHRRTRVFWSRRDMDILISWIEANKPDCIGHGRRQDCERIKKEVFATRTEFTPKTIKEKLLNMKKKYRQATMIKNETSADSIKSEDDDDKDEPRDDNQDDERFDLAINNPRFEGLSLKDRIEKICPFYDRIDRLKIRVQTEANPCKLSHNPINLPQRQTLVADSEMNPETKKLLLEDVSIEAIVSILKERQTSFSQNIMDPTADQNLVKEKQSEGHQLIENIIKTVLPSFFSTNRGQNQATPNMPLSSLDPSLNPNAQGDNDNYNTVVASALAVAVSTFISTFNLGYGMLENHQKIPESSAQPFNFQSVQSNDDLSLQISDKFNQNG